MSNCTRYLGLDVHAETISAAIAEERGKIRSLGKFPNRPDAVRKVIDKLGGSKHLKVCYEAGPTGSCPKSRRRDSPMNSRRYGAWKGCHARAIWPLMLPMTLQFIIVMIASAINDRLQRKLDYVEEERRILQERLDAVMGGKKILTDSVDGFLRNATYLIHDRDPLFTEALEAILRDRGVKCVKIPARSPNCNPHAERFVQTIKYECLNHLVLFGERHLRHVITEFMAHYHRERFHQGLGGQLIEVNAGATNAKGAHGKIVCRSRLGGMLNFYQQEAA
jgi:hypothetical protein